MRIIEEENLLANCTEMGARLMTHLEALKEKYEVIGDVRGKGLFCGAELVSSRASKAPMEEERVAQVVAECDKRGVLIGMTNRSLPGLNNTLCMSPPLIATKHDIDRIASTLDEALAAVFGL